MKKLESFLAGGGGCAVIFGGAGAEHNISRLSASGFIAEAERLGFDVLPIFIDKNGDFYFYSGDFADIADLERGIDRNALAATFPVRLAGKSGFLYEGGVIPVRLAVPVLHGDFGEDGRVQGLLECAGIGLFGADTCAGALMSDKAYAKAVAERAGVQTLPWLDFDRAEFVSDAADVAGRILREIGLPAFIKPTGLGSSIGATKANTEAEVCLALRAAFALSRRVMAEPALENPRELECAYLKLSQKELITHPAEVITGGRFYDYERKYLNTGEVRLSVRADVPEEISRSIRESSKRLAVAFGARHIARFDYFLGEDGSLYFNEVNSFPGLTENSLYTKMLESYGISYADFVKGALSI